MYVHITVAPMSNNNNYCHNYYKEVYGMVCVRSLIYLATIIIC